MKKITLSLFLYLFTVAGYCQLPISSLFDLKKSVTAISKATLTESDGFGEGRYYTEKLPNGKLKVRYTYDKPSPPNPIFITYTYGIEVLPSGDFALDMLAAMPPLSMYNDTNAVSLSYTGDKIILPNHSTSDTLLPDAKGTFILKMLATNDIFLTYEVAVTNRKFISAGNITLNGKIYEAYKHSYDFVQKTIINYDEVIVVIQEAVTEWLIPNYGQVLQNRTGTQITTTTTHQLTTESKLQSTLLQLKN